MAKAIGLSNRIKLQWLNKTVDLLDENYSEAEFKDKLNEYLSFEIDSLTVLRKTREILMQIWYYDNPDISEIRNEAKSLLNKDTENVVPVHWAVMMLAYPVFADICRTIGRMSEFQDEITLAQIKQKMFDEWGERSTLFQSIRKTVPTMKDFGVLTTVKPGRYTINRKKISDPKVVNLLIKAAMYSDGGSYHSFEDLKEFEVLFPFEYKLDKNSIYQDDSFDVGTFGGEVNVSIK